VRLLRATRCAADERHGEPFGDQNITNVAAVRFQRAAVATVVAPVRPDFALRARASNVFNGEI
jgi:hypothetical protein